MTLTRHGLWFCVGWVSAAARFLSRGFASGVTFELSGQSWSSSFWLNDQVHLNVLLLPVSVGNVLVPAVTGAVGGPCMSPWITPVICSASKIELDPIRCCSFFSIPRKPRTRPPHNVFPTPVYTPTFSDPQSERTPSSKFQTLIETGSRRP